MTTNWYATTTGYEKNHQGLVCDETTGTTIAVTYDAKHAPLIAAAPELLAACESIYEKLERSGFGSRVDGLHDHADNALTMLRIAIAKAKGE